MLPTAKLGNSRTSCGVIGPITRIPSTRPTLTTLRRVTRNSFIDHPRCNRIRYTTPRLATSGGWPAALPTGCRKTLTTGSR
jgi:hypothetical protein